ANPTDPALNLISRHAVCDNTWVTRDVADPTYLRYGEESGRFHLVGEHAAARPALVLPLARVVGDVARDDRPDVHRLRELLRRVDGAVDQLPRRGRAVRLVADEVHRRRVRRDGGQRHDQVAGRVVRLEAATRADAHQPRAAELDQLLEEDGSAGTAHPGA